MSIHLLQVMELMHEMMANELHISQQHEDHEQQQHRSMLAAQAQVPLLNASSLAVCHLLHLVY